MPKKNKYKKKNIFYKQKKHNNNKKKKYIFKKKKIFNKKFKNKNFFFKKKKNIIRNINKKKIFKKKINKKISLNKKINKKIFLNKKINKKKTLLNKKIFLNKKKTYKNYLRPPIVTILGHVNHGKTSLIDYIKSTEIVKKEKGNITQYINAYYINNKFGNFTILDTPGHSIFTNMRYRGINITDIILLIIAIDDGIMPQTLEIIDYIKKYNIPIIVGLSKIDKINYLNNIDIIKKKISKYNIIPKEWGGNNIFVNFSTKSSKGIEKIFQAIKKESKKLNLNTNINDYASGYIIESTVNKNKGIITNILIKNGTLKIGDIILSKNIFGKIKLICDDNKEKIKYGLPSMPVEILGLSKIALPGEKFTVIKNKKIIKKIINLENKKLSIKKNKNINKIENIFKKKEKINIIFKTDVYGSLDAITKIINKKFKKKINVISSQIGDINKNDLILAKTTKSIIIGFNIKINNLIKKNISKLNIKIYFFNIIYKLIKKIKKIIKNKFKLKNKIIIGRAKVKNIFSKSKSHIIIGCIVIEGNINLINPIQIIRNKYIIYKGKIKSLKRFKDKVKIIKRNIECGIHIEKFTKINIGDIIECIKTIKNN